MRRSTITAIFDDVSGIVGGTASCNSYTGTLIPQDGFFTVGPIASTLMACAAPEGVMEQESAYLAALGATDGGYQWERPAGKFNHSRPVVLYNGR
ncbi:MAG: META domain-containing protein [Chloroflexota bacterium]